MNLHEVLTLDPPSATSAGGRPLQLKEQAYVTLKSYLIQGTLSPGTLLSERKLAVQLGMSNTPVRSAIERLENEGYLDISPQQGILVRDLSLREIDDQFEIRMAVEAFVLRNLAGSLTEENIDQLRANIAANRLAIETGDQRGGIEQDMEFHRLLARAGGNREVIRLINQICDRMLQVLHRTPRRDPARQLECVAEHEEILEALIEGDGELAATHLATHFRRGKAALLSPVS